MNSVTVLLVLLATFSIISLVLLSTYSLWRMSKSLSEVTQTTKEVELAQVDLLSKLSGLLAAKDPMAYQAIAAMDSNLPSTLVEEDIRTPEELITILANEQYPPGKEEAYYDSVERDALSDL